MWTHAGHVFCAAPPLPVPPQLSPLVGCLGKPSQAGFCALGSLYLKCPPAFVQLQSTPSEIAYLTPALVSPGGRTTL